MKKRTRVWGKVLLLSLLAAVAVGPMLYTFVNSFSGSASTA